MLWISSEALINERDDTPFKDTGAFIERVKKLLSEEDQLNIGNTAPLISVSSTYFQLETAVTMDNAKQPLFSLLQKGQQGIGVLSRTLGNY